MTPVMLERSTQSVFYELTLPESRSAICLLYYDSYFAENCPMMT